MQVHLKSVEVFLRNLDIARTWQVNTHIWPGCHSQWHAFVYPRHVSAPYCLHFSAPAIAENVNAAGGVAMTASIALYCGCSTQPFSVPAATSLVTTLQTPFRLHWCMCWSSRHDSLQLNDILVWCCCCICFYGNEHIIKWKPAQTTDECTSLASQPANTWHCFWNSFSPNTAS